MENLQRKKLRDMIRCALEHSDYYHKELSALLDFILEKKLKFVRYWIQFVEQIKLNPKTGKKPLVFAGGLPDVLSA